MMKVTSAAPSNFDSSTARRPFRAQPVLCPSPKRTAMPAGAKGQVRQAKQTASETAYVTGGDDNLSQYIHDISNVKLLSAQEEISLARAANRGDKEALEQLIRANLRLVIHMASRYRNRGLGMSDLVQEGNLGLMRAAEKFDPELGNRFSTYAVWWIRQAVSRAVSEHASLIRLPGRAADELASVQRLAREFYQFNGYQATSDQLGELAGLPADRVRELQLIAETPTSLDTPLINDEVCTLGATLEDTQTPPALQIVAQEELRQQLQALLNLLNSRDRQILELRYGLADGCSCTLDEVSRRLKISKQRVGMIERQALRRLLPIARAAGCHDYLMA